MSIVRCVLLFAVLAIPGLASAQIDPGTDGIGIYFDQAATINCITTTAPFEMIHAYLCATNLSEPSGISGWEACFSHQGSGLIAPAWSLTSGCWNPFPPCFACGIGTDDPLPWAPVIILGQLTAFVQAPGMPIQFFLDGAPSPSLPQYPHNPVYAAGNNAFNLKPLWISSGGYQVPVAAINGDCPIPDAGTTWGAVKVLYE